MTDNWSLNDPSFTHRIEVFKIHDLFPLTIQSYFLLNQKTFFCFVKVCDQYWPTDKWSLDNPSFTHRIKVFKIHDLFPLTIQSYFLLNQKNCFCFVKVCDQYWPTDKWSLDNPSFTHRIKVFQIQDLFPSTIQFFFCSIKKLSSVLLKSVFDFDWLISGHLTIHHLLIESKFFKYTICFLQPFNLFFAQSKHFLLFC